MLTGEQQGNVCLIEPAGDWFSEIDVTCFPFSLQIANSFREVFRLRGFVVYFSIGTYLFHFSLQSTNF